MSIKPKKFNEKEFRVSPDTFRSGLYKLNNFYSFKGYTWDQIIASAGSGENLLTEDEPSEEDVGYYPDMAQGSYIKSSYDTEAPIPKEKYAGMSARNKRFIKQYGPAGDKRLIKTACALEVIQAYLEQVYPGKNIRLASPSGGNPH